jgi:hypothetical protein
MNLSMNSLENLKSLIVFRDTTLGQFGTPVVPCDRVKSLDLLQSSQALPLGDFGKHRKPK